MCSGICFMVKKDYKHYLELVVLLNQEKECRIACQQQGESDLQNLFSQV